MADCCIFRGYVRDKSDRRTAMIPTLHRTATGLSLFAFILLAIATPVYFGVL